METAAICRFGEMGQQYVTDIGRIDIHARSKDGKNGSWVKKNEAEPNDEVRGIVIAGEEDERLKYALSNLDCVEYMTYSISIDLQKISI